MIVGQPKKMSSNASGIIMAVVFTLVGPVLRKTIKFDSVALKNNFLVCKEVSYLILSAGSADPEHFLECNIIPIV